MMDVQVEPLDAAPPRKKHQSRSDCEPLPSGVHTYRLQRAAHKPVPPMLARRAFASPTFVSLYTSQSAPVGQIREYQDYTDVILICI